MVASGKAISSRPLDPMMTSMTRRTTTSIASNSTEASLVSRAIDVIATKTVPSRNERSAAVVSVRRNHGVTTDPGTMTAVKAENATVLARTDHGLTIVVREVIVRRDVVATVPTDAAVTDHRAVVATVRKAAEATVRRDAEATVRTAEVVTDHTVVVATANKDVVAIVRKDEEDASRAAVMTEVVIEAIANRSLWRNVA